MKLFILFGIFFSPNLWAQLYVQPSGREDTFLYVKDRLLYVEKEIGLIKNEHSIAEASIYLRKEAQLIQGDKPQNANYGSGQISAYQEGTSNAFDYNFWSLPVKNSTQNFQDIIYEPKTAIFSLPAQLTPDLNGSSDPLKISRRWLYKYNGTSYDDWDYIGNNFDLKPGEGFSMKGVNGTDLTQIEGVFTNPGNSQRYDFRGLPNDGNINLPLQKDKLLLTGNPYPSALNLRKFLLENPATTGLAYFWDSKENGQSHYLREYEGGYGVYSPGANAYAPPVFRKYSGSGEALEETGNTGEFYGREFSPIAQGFMIQARESGSLNFKNSHRIYKTENLENSWFKIEEKEIPLLKVDIEFKDHYVRQLLLALDPYASTGEDWAKDARLMGQLKNDAGWKIEDKLYVIHVRPYSKNTKIPLQIEIAEPMQIHFSAEFIRAGMDLIPAIWDDINKSFHQLQIPYQIDLEPGSYDNRFFLSFIEPTEEQSGDEVSFIDDTSQGVIIIPREEFLELNFTERSLPKHIRLYSLNGSLIYDGLNHISGSNYRIPSGGLSNSVYIIKIHTESGEIINQKLRIKR